MDMGDMDHDAVMDLVSMDKVTNMAMKSGEWSDPTVWGGTVPAANARVHIPADVMVTYDLSSSPLLKTVRIDGSLMFSRTKSTGLTVETLVVMCGSLDIGTKESPIPANINVNIKFRSDTNIDTNEDPMQEGRGLVNMGALRIHGEMKSTFHQLANGVSKGGKNLVLNKLPRNWKVGDRVVLTGSKFKGGNVSGVYQGTEDEVRTIAAIDGANVTLDSGLTYDHKASKPELNSFLANFSRNIVFENTTGSSTIPSRRGHIMSMGSDAEIYYSEIRSLGRTDKSKSIDDPMKQINGAPGYGTNPRGRYPLHFHRVGTVDPLTSRPAEVIGNTVTDGAGWGVVNHDSYVLIEDNAAYDVFGAAFVTENGGEMGSFRRNIAIKSRGWDTDHDIKKNSTLHDFGRYGSGFWFQGRNVVVEDNVACGHSEAAFFWWHRSKAMDWPNFFITPSVSPNQLLSPLGYAKNRSAYDTYDKNDKDFTVDDAPIVHAKRNFACASFIGLRVVKANPFQQHKVRSVFEDWTMYNNDYGMEPEYTRYYTFRNLEIHSDDGRGRQAIVVGSGVRDLVLNSVRTSGYGTDIKFHVIDDVERVRFGEEEDSIDGSPLPRDVLMIDFIAEDKSTPKYSNYNPEWYVSLDKSDLTSTANQFIPADGGAPSYLPSSLGWTFARGFNVYGTQIDSTGSWSPYPLKWYGDWAKSELRKGYYTDSIGHYINFKEVISDRATGRDYVFYKERAYIPSSYTLDPNKNLGQEPSSSPALLQARGEVFDVKSSKTDEALVTEERALLLNDSGSGELQVHLPTLISPAHGKLTITQDGSFRYLPDVGFIGTDSFQYQVWDGQRLSSMVTVQLNVADDGQELCASDLNGDGVSDSADLGVFIQYFMSGSAEVDFNGDGIIDHGDISTFLALFGSESC